MNILEKYITRLERKEDEFEATTEDGQQIRAKKVAVCTGFKYFKNVPEIVSQSLPDELYGHSCDEVNLKRFKGKKIFILGGRQSAFESAALLHESGCKEIHICYRHKTPAFTHSDWSWIPPLVTQTEEKPGWYHELLKTEKDDIQHRLWVEGREKLEPWLHARISQPNIHCHPQSHITQLSHDDQGDILIQLDTGKKVEADFMLLATGYQVDVRQLPFLQGSHILDKLSHQNGIPKLDHRFQSSIEGLYFSSLVSTPACGPFYGFLVGTNASSRIIGKAVAGS